MLYFTTAYQMAYLFGWIPLDPNRSSWYHFQCQPGSQKIKIVIEPKFFETYGLDSTPEISNPFFHVITFWFGTANIKVFRYEFENIIFKLCTYVFNTLLYGIVLCTYVKIFSLGVHMKSNDPPISLLFEVLLRLNRKFVKAIIK